MSTARVTNLQNEASSVVNLALDESGNVTIGNNLTVTGTTTQTGSTTFTAQTLFPDGSAAAPAISNTGDTNTGIYFPAADTIGFVEGGVEAMRLDASGNLGLGVTPSAWYTTYSTKGLQVGSLSSLSYDGYTGATNIGFNVYQSAATTFNYIADGIVASRYSLEAGAHKWFTTGTTTGSAGSAISFTQAMTLDASGNLNIGASSGTGRLFVVVGNNATYQVAGNYTNNTNADFQIQIASNATLLTPSTATPLCFGTSNTERARIDASGNLLVGTTSGYNNSRVSIISDNSGLNRYTLNVQNTAATSTSQTQNILLRLSSNGTGADTCINFTDAVTHNYYVGGANGELYAINGYGGAKIVGGGTAWSSNSDERLKNISGYYNDALNDISQIMPFKFTWKDRDNKPCVGVSAQSVQKVIPEAVDEGSDGYLMVRYTDMLPLVIASIQELAAKVSALEAKQ